MSGSLTVRLYTKSDLSCHKAVVLTFGGIKFFWEADNTYSSSVQSTLVYTHKCHMILREFVDPVNPVDPCRLLVKSPCSQGNKKVGCKECVWKGDPREGRLSNTWKGIVWGDTHTDESRRLLKRGAGVKSSRVRQPGRTALPRGLQS